MCVRADIGLSAGQVQRDGRVLQEDTITNLVSDPQPDRHPDTDPHTITHRDPISIAHTNTDRGADNVATNNRQAIVCTDTHTHRDPITITNTFSH
jgi:hypothetical protein